MCFTQKHGSSGNVLNFMLVVQRCSLGRHTYLLHRLRIYTVFLSPSTKNPLWNLSHNIIVKVITMMYFSFQVRCPSLFTDLNRTHNVHSACAEIVKYKGPGNFL